MTLNEDHLFDIIQNIGATILSLEIKRLSPEESRGDIESEFLCAWMQAEGNWHGGLLFTCQESFVRQAASIIYEVSENMLAEDAVHDTIGELANIIAGAASALLPEGVSLLQPEVLEEADLPELCLTGWPVLNLSTHHRGQLLYLSLFKEDKYLPRN